MLSQEQAQIEALLFASDVPLTTQRIAELLVLPVGRIERELEILEEQYRAQGHCFFVAQEGRGIRLRTLPQFAELLMAINGEAAKLSRPALEVLSILAMRKTATRPEIDRLRSVDSDSVVNGLLARNLIEEAGRDDSPGRAISYRVTDHFLKLFGVASLSDLQEEYSIMHKQAETETPATTETPSIDNPHESPLPETVPETSEADETATDSVPTLPQ
ncbi:MAG: SMC-Scp complex subunit ScpB [bacterium]|nr:SMC-Scp complex subunit ScpB [bacterium]